MSWNNNGGWQGGGNRGPWSQGPQGGGTPPDLEELIRKGQERLQQMLPGGSMGSKGLALIGVAVVGLWLASGFYRVNPGEVGVVTRFGAFSTQTQPGLNYHLPWPIEAVQTPPVLRVNRVDVGFRSGPDGGRPDQTRPTPEESLMLTGDENIVDANFSVLWVINDASKFLFNVSRPESTVKAVAESAMREVIGRSNIQSILTEGRTAIERDVAKLMQETLDGYGAGIRITQVQMQQVDPPAAVIGAFRDVQAARADLERSRNEAEGYANDVIPRARGEATKIVQEAEAYKQQVVAGAQGEAQRFVAIYNEYRNSKDVTRQRLYLEMMERVLGDMNKVVVDQKGQGVIPLMNLQDLTKRTPQGSVTTQPAGAN